MTAARAKLPDGMTPYLVSREAAAALCGMSPNHFDAHVRVEPVTFGRRKLYHVETLKRWLDERAGLTKPIQPVEDWVGKIRAGGARARR